MLTILQYNHWKGVLDQLSPIPFLVGLDRVRKESQSQDYLAQISAYLTKFEVISLFQAGDSGFFFLLTTYFIN